MGSSRPLRELAEREQAEQQRAQQLNSADHRVPPPRPKFRLKFSKRPPVVALFWGGLAAPAIILILTGDPNDRTHQERTIHMEPVEKSLDNINDANFTS